VNGILLNILEAMSFLKNSRLKGSTITEDVNDNYFTKMQSDGKSNAIAEQYNSTV
jgi:hypothetical protein